MGLCGIPLRRNGLFSPIVIVLLLVAVISLIRPRDARNCAPDATLDELSDSEPNHAPEQPRDYATETRTHTETQFQTVTATVTLEQSVSTVTQTERIRSVETMLVPDPKLNGLPGYCDECGPDDAICGTYGQYNLERSRAYEGPNTRLRRVLKKAADGHPINIGVLGGSVTAGHGVVYPEGWTDIFFQWWNATFPHENNVFVNGAIPATTTEYFSVCALEHIDEDVDIVLVEMAINDQRLEQLAHTYESLVRMLLELPNKPAVVNVQVMALVFDTISLGGDLHIGVAEYYDLPVISLRNVALYHILENPILDRRMFHRVAPYLEESDADLRHMNRVGHRMTADLLIAYMQRQICARLKLERDSSPYRFQSRDNTIPPPHELGEIPRLSMFRKYVHDEREQLIKTTCLSTRSKKHPLQPIVSSGWTEWAWKEKTYLIAREPGSRATFKITVGPKGIVRITYLRSKTFGLGTVKCWVDEKEAEATVVDGWWDIDVFNISRDIDIAQGVSPGVHEVTCELLEDTKDPGGGREFRLISLTSL